MSKKELKIFIVCMILSLSFMGVCLAQITVEKTIPQEIQLSNIREHVTNVGKLSEVTIDVHLKNGKSYTLSNAEFRTFWSGLTSSQKTVIQQYIIQTSILAASVDPSKVTGTWGE